jgi:hypothetical protein
MRNNRDTNFFLLLFYHEIGNKIMCNLLLKMIKIINKKKCYGYSSLDKRFGILSISHYLKNN